MRIIGQAEVRERLSFDLCIPVVREVMKAFSAGRTQQLLRSIIPLAQGRVFGIMPGTLGHDGVFGAKLISVFPDNAHTGRQSHQGLVVLFDPVSGAPVCIVHAGEITAVRTAAMSAVATDALSRPNSRLLAILGTGEQAKSHARAIAKIRSLSAVRIWGRSPARAQELATWLSKDLGLSVVAVESAEAAVDGADIICTVSATQTPILLGRWIAPGAHLNLVGSSLAGRTEVDHDVVTKSRFIADSREGVLSQGAEFLLAKAEGLVDDQHVVGEIGQVLNGDLEGRQSQDQITAFKSPGPYRPRPRRRPSPLPRAGLAQMRLWP